MSHRIRRLYQSPKTEKHLKVLLLTILINKSIKPLLKNFFIVTVIIFDERCLKVA